MREVAGKAAHEADCEGENGPTRTCALRRTEHPVADLLRFVVAPDGTVVPDLAGNLPGRGVWLSCDRVVVSEAARTGAFPRSLKRAVRTPPDLAGDVERGLEKRAIGALSIANKAGLVVSGFAKVEALIADKGAQALLHAADAAADGRDKLDRKFAAVARESGVQPIILDTLTSDQMSLAMGRANVVHAALKPGGASEKFIGETGRLQRYRSSPGPSRTQSLPT